MYYHRIIVNFKKLSSGNKFFLHILVNILQDGTDVAVYPRQFSGVYMIAYGIVGTVSNIDPDKTYDYHTAFDIHPTEVVYNVDINTNNKKILNVNVDRNNDNSAATVGLFKELAPYTTNAFYRANFSEFYDFSDANSYNITKGSSGVTYTGLNPNITFTTKHIAEIQADGLRVNGYGLTVTVPHSPNFTMCVVMQFWRNKRFTLFANVTGTNLKIEFKYEFKTTRLTLTTSQGSQVITLPSSMNGKRIVIWLTENSNARITKAKVSNYASTLTQASSPLSSQNQRTNFGFSSDDGVIHRLMYSTNFYDFDSEVYHRVLIQKKLSGSYVE